MRLRSFALSATLGCVLVLAGCNKPKPAANSLDAMDNALVNDTIGGENNSLASAIKVDPAKACKKGSDCRPATTTLAEAARHQAAQGGGLPQGESPADNAALGPCLADLSYSNDWAAKLPADLPMMAGAKLQEAAGRDTPCLVRVVSFSAPGDRAAVLAWYGSKARAAGYSAKRTDKDGDAILAGDKTDGAGYYIIIGRDVGGRTPVDYIWARG